MARSWLNLRGDDGVREIPAGEIRPGDFVVDDAGRRVFRVDRTAPARARGYVVLVGEGFIGERRGRTQFPIGHRDSTVRVERPSGW